MDVFVDVETIPSQRNEAKERAAARVSPPGNISKAETIAKWEAETRPGKEEEEWKRSALDGGWGELCCICWAVDDGPVLQSCRPSLEDSEKHMLATFLGAISDEQEQQRGRPITWIGHNITGFDLRFLWQRAVVLGIKPPIKLQQDATPWSGKVIDTMHTWAGNRGSIKLTDLCAALRIDVGHDDTIDGSMVWDEYKAGRFYTVLHHCRADVERVREVYRRMV